MNYTEKINQIYNETLNVVQSVVEQDKKLEETLRNFP